MKTYHIHIKGLVQGVGFRPYVFREAALRGLNGIVYNSKDGVHIEINASEDEARSFYKQIIQAPPSNAILTSHTFVESGMNAYESFTITTGEGDTQPDLLIPPDYALCNNCRNEITDRKNRRYRYPFTTCLHCGPRYSIIRELPYERINSSMAIFSMCSDCKNEYEDMSGQRHYSQTNSCMHCAIPMHLYDKSRTEVSNVPADIFRLTDNALKAGNIVAVKGMGGYLLLCDACNETAITLLRERKHRPLKPFALLYCDIAMAVQDVVISTEEKKALESKVAPIVLCKLKENPASGIISEVIAPGLDKIGLMFPSTSLLQIISHDVGMPLVATSANLTGSPIIFNDADALEKLPGIADLILSYDREIMIPEDDSVMQVNATGGNIILRRSRGLSPNYFPSPFTNLNECTLAMGGDLKSAFALQTRDSLYVSQYLGNQENLDSQHAYTQTVGHLLALLQAKPSVLLADKHPGYFVTHYARELAIKYDLPLYEIQHHEAHFGAVLAENGLLETKKPVLGFIWDGTGYGDDNQVWGGEIMIFENNDIQRLAHLDYFPQLLGDKMSREPRLSALSILKQLPGKLSMIKPHFSETEWKYYHQLIGQPATLLTSSMGRLIDAIAALTGTCQVNTYEGEAAMKLESLARCCNEAVTTPYPIVPEKNRLNISMLLHEITEDIQHDIPARYIAKKFFYSLSCVVGILSEQTGIDNIAFSGGVFQNALLTEMIIAKYANNKQLFWHQQLSTNDECIGFGQLACYHIMKLQEKKASLKTGSTIVSGSNIKNYIVPCASQYPER